MNNITGITYAPGKSIIINWSPSGLPASLTDWTNTTLNFNYNAAQQFTGYTVGSVQTTYGYDGNGSLNSAAVTRAGTSLFNAQLTRNAAGQITSESRTAATIPDLAPGVQGTAYNAASQPILTYCAPCPGNRKAVRGARLGRCKLSLMCGASALPLRR